MEERRAHKIANTFYRPPKVSHGCRLSRKALPLLPSLPNSSATTIIQKLPLFMSNLLAVQAKAVTPYPVLVCFTGHDKALGSLLESATKERGKPNKYSRVS